MAEIEIGGNSIVLSYGNALKIIADYYTRRSTSLISSGSKIVVSNPTYKIVNPFTLVVSFTVGNTQKYQLVTQGDYKIRYKELENDTNPINDQELFILIQNGRTDWFKKE